MKGFWIWVALMLSCQSMIRVDSAERSAETAKARANEALDDAAAARRECRCPR